MGLFEWNVVVDLEFTPIKGAPKRKKALRSEIVEIGAVRIDADGNEVDDFSIVVDPELNHGVAPHIASLTGITNADVRKGCHVGEALGRFAGWIADRPGRTRLVAWSNADECQVKRECAHKGIEVPPQLARWHNLQVTYPRLMGVGRGKGKLMSLKEAATWYGVQVDPHCAHRALYDAQVTAALLRSVLTGEYRTQRRVLAGSITSAERIETATSSIGDAHPELAELLRRMRARA